MKYPKRLSSGANNIVIALNQNEVAQLYMEDIRYDLGSEAEKMKYANNVNQLASRFLGWILMKKLKQICW